MRRLLSLVVALVLVMGTVSVFAASAEWSGFYELQYRSISKDPKNSKATYDTYMAHKLELYPSFKLSDNVTVKAGFFWQDYMGKVRYFGAGESVFISEDSGGHQPNFGNANDSGYSLAPTTTDYNAVLGVSSASVSLSFLEGALGIDAGRIKVAPWGTGAFFGSSFFADRVVVSYKTPALGGLLIPVFIYERRNDFNHTTPADNFWQWNLAAIHLKPGTSLMAIVFNGNHLGKRYAANQFLGNPVLANDKKDSTFYLVADAYIDYKIKMDGGLSIKPIFEIAYGTGTIVNDAWNLVGAYGTPAGMNEIDASFLNFILKAEIAMNKLVTIIPEIGMVSGTKKTKMDGLDPKTAYNNPFGINQFCGGTFTIGNIIGSLMSDAAGVDENGKAVDGKWSYYGKLDVEVDLLDTVVKGLGANVYFVYAGTFGSKRDQNATGTVKFDSLIAWEAGLGLSYQIDSFTTFGIDLAMSKTGKAERWGSTSAANQKRTDLYMGTDLTVKF